MDTNITQELKEEGVARDLMRQIQQLRKEQNLTLADKTNIFAPGWPKSYEQLILKGTASASITLADQLKIEKV